MAKKTTATVMTTTKESKRKQKKKKASVSATVSPSSTTATIQKRNQSNDDNDDDDDSPQAKETTTTTTTTAKKGATVSSKSKRRSTKRRKKEEETSSSLPISSSSSLVTEFSLRGGGGTLALYTEDTIKCSNSKCEEELFTQAQDYITLSSCNHSLCVMCFATQVASAGCNNYITYPCSGCKQPSNSYTVHDVVLSKKRTESIVLPSIVEKQFVIADPDKEMDPIRHYQEQTKNTENTSFFSLTLATSSKSNKRLQFITNTGIFLYKRSSELISVLEIIFKTMHGCLITHDPLSMQYNPFSFPTEASIDRAVENDRSPLHRCLFALSYGQTIKSVSNNTNLGKKWWNALMKKAFCITDLYRNLRTKHDGFVSSLVSKHVTAQDTPGNAGIYILTELSSEIDTLKKELNASMAIEYARSIRKSKKGTNIRDFRIETIVNAREKLISLNPNWKNDRLKKLQAGLQVQKQNEMNALQARIQKELELIGYDRTRAKEEAANIKKTIQMNKCIELNDNNDQHLIGSQTTNSTVDMMRCSQSIGSGYTIK